MCITATDVGGRGARGLRGFPEEPAMPREWAAARGCVGVARAPRYARPAPGAFSITSCKPHDTLRGWPCDYSQDTDEAAEAQRQEGLKQGHSVGVKEPKVLILSLQ